MPVCSYQVSAHSTAPPEKVFGLLTDAPGWSRWAGPAVPRSWWERGGDTEQAGVGAIRCLGTRLLHSREQIVEYQPPRRLAYTVLSGWPVRSYRAEVTLEARDGGTAISWSASFEPPVAACAPILLALTRLLVGGFARRLAATAGRFTSD